MNLKRRQFLRRAGTGLAAALLDPRRLFSPPQEGRLSAAAAPPLFPQLADDEYPFPYDASAFLCAERLYDLRPAPDGASRWRANLNLLLRADAILDIKVSVAEERERLAAANVVHSYSGVTDSLTVPLSGNESERLYYQVQFRKSGGSWSALSPKSFRLPNARLSQGRHVRVLVFADDHTFDDVDPELPSSHQELMRSGDYVNEFLRHLRDKPDWTPESPLQRLVNGFELARAMRHVLEAEDPDFLIHLGDTTGIGASYRFKALGLPEYPATDQERALIARTLWLRMRKLYSALTPSLPMFIALGNHDGEEGWNSLRAAAREWRLKYFPLPTDRTYPEGGHPQGNYYAFTWGADEDGRGGVEFIILDCTAFCGAAEPRRLEDWTLGPEQLEWLGGVLEKREKHWILPCVHHVLGGWPAGPEEDRSDVAYGRGPLFLADDYREYADPQSVEQVRITDRAAQAGAAAFLYGHDHIFHSRRLAAGWNRKEMRSLCAGSTKHMGEVWWWMGSLWRKHYGSSSSPTPDFFGPPGYMRLTIGDRTLTADCVATPADRTPEESEIILNRVVIENPPPRLLADPPSLTVAAEQGSRGRVTVPLRIKNEGSGRLDFTLSASKSWLSCSPAAGASWGEWEEASVSFQPRFMAAGHYGGTLTVEGPGADNTPLRVPLDITILPPTVRPPRALRGAWEKTRDGRDYVLLTWRPERDNRDLSRYHVYLAVEEGSPRFLGPRALNRCDYVYARGGRRRLTFLVTAVSLQGRESEPATCTVE
ncbi:MAG: metallophosphoesterase [Candidatus Aminicenantes bacterium]|nr:metallophosphoesterase [Candidatus Aminicenantes bacterium]